MLYSKSLSQTWETSVLLTMWPYLHVVFKVTISDLGDKCFTMWPYLHVVLKVTISDLGDKCFTNYVAIPSCCIQSHYVRPGRQVFYYVAILSCYIQGHYLRPGRQVFYKLHDHTSKYELIIVYFLFHLNST